MEQKKIVSPLEDIIVISDLIKRCTDSSTLHLPAGSIFDPSSSLHFSTILFENGSFSFYRKHDSRLILNLQAPFPVGITSSVAHGRNFYIKTDSPTKMLVVPFDVFKNNVEKENKWKEIVNILTYLIDLNEEYIRLSLLNNNNYDVIRTGLSQIWELPESERGGVSLYKFIQSRYSISRSSIDKIVRELRVGGYIKTNRGCLLEMKELPEKF
ncbi:helix-turn-helix domain-containing protein [Citrobacter portucalensis]|uniref:helix-turn-helix domain-containing protein n=1 Tax=Citrobacter portucalensis TaxID=1639133 RepID=UPI00226B902B|nr:helix-turn-helix domain-containing protein [Citrobacter portucalensis]MCX8981026.1 helix-turn-helix domain-containing protein [Citrobacter portucalensis]